MSDTVVFIDSDEVVVVEDTAQVHVVSVQQDLQVVSVGEVGPPGEDVAGGSAGQVFTIDSDGVTRVWADPAVSGATPADIANVMAFAATNG